MIRLKFVATLISLVTFTTIVAGTAPACSPNDKVLFKCSQNCGGTTSSVPDICESSDKSPEDIAKTAQNTLADAGLSGCTWSCSKTDSACKQQ